MACNVQVICLCLLHAFDTLLLAPQQVRQHNSAWQAQQYPNSSASLPKSHSANKRISNMSAAYIVSRRDKAMQELHTKPWLQQLPADLRKTLLALTCTPADIFVVKESHWIQQHAGTDMPDGSCIASPAEVNQCLHWFHASGTYYGPYRGLIIAKPLRQPLQNHESGSVPAGIQT